MLAADAFGSAAAGSLPPQPLMQAACWASWQVRSGFNCRDSLLHVCMMLRLVLRELLLLRWLQGVQHGQQWTADGQHLHVVVSMSATPSLHAAADKLLLHAEQTERKEANRQAFESCGGVEKHH
jgi:hypothetical protein